ncbi:MAG: ATP-binding cassette domain-containing protein [Candidatus Caldatribacterium sp.]|uniref:ATP-binding cassette domain-containing protein n=1 Tax=Candidatus Caldatribacterium sp. TaxID=2282143 RepID=UPI00299811F6|nr:ATP-binding cassette domain-containing protein [Candidatus Caldatribacterium sp.]MCX7731461.1 ATP-binding cassette domain-containing protein [Candidatus Caldatribacterium sp.]MDW8080621.1 ATP-binding cassette domain-containing protein [Candidatus Calescibacterium sp.]
MAEPSEVLVKMVNIRKSFGHVEVLRGVNFEVGYNEIVGLLGDNGAGKSTLIKILTGVHQPDSGEIYWKGQKLVNYSVSKARELGIETVFQERALSEQHSLWRNIFMGREITNRWGFLDIRKQREEAERIIREYMGFTSSALSVDAVVGTMSGGEKQGVAIARALHFQADLIILDEPTTGLSLSETQKVLSFVEEIKKKGKSAIFITHNIYHVYPVADRIVILDRGRVVGEFMKAAIPLEKLVEKLYLVARTGRLNGEEVASEGAPKGPHGLESLMP